jgi:hypothetical protein
MDHELTPDEIHDLLAPYALDAVDDDERAAVDAYLADHPDARREVAELQAAASMLAHTGGAPPEGVWERLESIVTSSPPPPRVLPPPTVLTPRSPPAPVGQPDRRWRWLAAAAAVVAFVFAGLWLVARGDDGGGAATSTAALAQQAAAAPGSRHVILTDEAGNELATAVVTRDGAGYLTSKLPVAAAGHTYQLWGISRTGTISLGVLGRDPGIVAFKAAVPTSALAITTEVAGGVPASQNAPDAVGDVST